MSPVTKDLIARLLDRSPRTRLGGGEADAEEVKAHPFFAGLQWEDVLARKLRPEWIPDLKDDGGAGASSKDGGMTGGANESFSASASR
jgi:hypothetical protein